MEARCKWSPGRRRARDCRSDLHWVWRELWESPPFGMLNSCVRRVGREHRQRLRRGEYRQSHQSLVGIRTLGAGIRSGYAACSARSHRTLEVSMQSRPVSVLAVAAVAALFVLPASARAQSLTIPDSPSFLVAGMASQQQTAPPPAQSSVGGIGFGIKGGWLYSSFSQAGESLESRSGWEAGIFVGGNRSGVVGLMAELMYARKSFEEGAISKTTNPGLFRDSDSSPAQHRVQQQEQGVIFYGLAGPVFDFNLKAERDGVDERRLREVRYRSPRRRRTRISHHPRGPIQLGSQRPARKIRARCPAT